MSVFQNDWPLNFSLHKNPNLKIVEKTEAENSDKKILIKNTCKNNLKLVEPFMPPRHLKHETIGLRNSYGKIQGSGNFTRHHPYIQQALKIQFDQIKKHNEDDTQRRLLGVHSSWPQGNRVFIKVNVCTAKCTPQQKHYLNSGT